MKEKKTMPMNTPTKKRMAVGKAANVPAKFGNKSKNVKKKGK